MRAIICDLCRSLTTDENDPIITLQYEGGMGVSPQSLDLHRSCLARIHSGDFEEDDE